MLFFGWVAFFKNLWLGPCSSDLLEESAFFDVWNHFEYSQYFQVISISVDCFLVSLPLKTFNSLGILLWYYHPHHCKGPQIYLSADSSPRGLNLASLPSGGHLSCRHAPPKCARRALPFCGSDVPRHATRAISSAASSASQPSLFSRFLPFLFWVLNAVASFCGCLSWVWDRKDWFLSDLVIANQLYWCSFAYQLAKLRISRVQILYLSSSFSNELFGRSRCCRFHLKLTMAPY